MNAGGFLGPFVKAGLFAQVIIVTLFVMSVFTWAIFIRKWRALRRARRETRRFLSRFAAGHSLFEYQRVASELKSSPLSGLLLAALGEWETLKKQVHASEAGPELMQQLIPNITEAMERAASREEDRLESSLPFLSITTMVAPFLGLLGTVQGVLSTFLALRGAQLPTLQLIAPGISDALVTTVMGLLVAIPAALFYNYFVGRVRALVSETDRFASELTGIFRRETVTLHLNRGRQSDSAQ
jgi:biopolymer transport protein TolQ